MSCIYGKGCPKCGAKFAGFILQKEWLVHSPMTEASFITHLWKCLVCNRTFRTYEKVKVQ